MLSTLPFLLSFALSASGFYGFTLWRLVLNLFTLSQIPFVLFGWTRYLILSLRLALASFERFLVSFVAFGVVHYVNGFEPLGPA